jgi:hypothetical protein
MAQVGAYDGSFVAISKDNRLVAQSDFRPQPGRRYHIRVEIEDNRMSMAIDGHRLCEWIDPFPIEGGYVGIFGQYPGKAFSGLRIYRREVPSRVPATAIGDGMVRAGSYDRAAIEYERLARSHPGTAIGEEARYKLGLCHWQLGLLGFREAPAQAPANLWEPDRAWLSPVDQRRARVAQAWAEWGCAAESWAPLRGGAYEHRIELHDLARAYADGGHEAVIAGTERLYAAADAQLRREIALQWQDQIQHAPRERLADYLALHDRAFPTESLVDYTAAKALYDLGRLDELLARFPAQRELCAWCLCDQRHFREVMKRYPDQRWVCRLAAFNGGFFDDLAEPDGGLYIDMLWMNGRAHEVAERFPKERELICHALLHCGDADIVLRDYPDQAWAQQEARLALGRAEEVMASGDAEGRARAAAALGKPEIMLADGGTDPQRVHMAKLMQAVIARAAGDPAWRTRLPPGDPLDLRDAWSFDTIVTQCLLLPLVDGLERGDPATVDRSCGEYLRRWPWAQRQRPAFFARFILGQADEGRLRKQPFCAFAEADILLARAVRAERHGERAAAREAYHAYLQTPLWARDEWIDATTGIFAAWRERELSR